MKIISGGQIGVDQAGLLAAMKAIGLGVLVETGGTAPKGYRTSTGSARWLAGLNVREHESPNYPPRAWQNVRDASITVLFGDMTSPGCRLTLKYVGYGAHLINPEMGQLAEHFYRYPDYTYNIAGNRVQRMGPDAYFTILGALIQWSKR